MPLITCPEPECKKKVSSTAKSCPDCGFDFVAAAANAG